MALLIEATVGAAVGAVFGELLRTVLEFKNKTDCFKSSLGNLQSSLESISPVIAKIEQLNNELGLSKEELQSLISKMEDGAQLVLQCSKIRWIHFVARACYKDKLDQFSNELLRIFNINMQGQMVIYQETLLKATRIDRVVEKPRFDLGEAIDNTLLMFLTLLIRVIFALIWIFPTLIRLAFTSSSTKLDQFALDKQLKREKGHFLTARSTALDIFGGAVHPYRLWEMPVPSVRYSEEGAEIVRVSSLKILGRIKTGMLSPNTEYGAYLVFKESSDGAYGFKNMPAKVSIRVNGDVTDSRIINLVVGKRRKLGVQYPKESGDGWMEVELGEFFNGTGDNKEVEIGLYDTDNHYYDRKAGGIIVQGIKISPKYES